MIFLILSHLFKVLDIHFTFNVLLGITESPFFRAFPLQSVVSMIKLLLFSKYKVTILNFLFFSKDILPFTYFTF